MKITSFFLLNFIRVMCLAQPQVSIIPQPVSLTVNNGNFIIDNATFIKFNKSNKDLQAAANLLSSYIKNISCYSLPLDIEKKKPIELSIEKRTGIGNEGYLLNVTPTSIKIVTNTKAGIVYGMQSLFQTLPQIRTNAALEIPCISITDYPRFKWRGMHLDVSRHFFSPEMIKEYIDLMAAYKFNTFHWHLTDDQGWRIEIKKYPKLTSVGAWRAARPGKVWSECEPTQPGEETLRMF
ncbi:MAG: family 20 glycosylhydrolase [Bacteroidota bacterium]|nr:family 20 glycosylhydrolase [Bacteroidota bacterium]